MAAQVSSLFRASSGFSDDRMLTAEISAGLVTQDFLGGSPIDGEMNEDLDLDSQVPIGWEKRLDLKSGKVYLRRSNPSAQNQPDSRDLNFPPSQSRITLNLFDESPLKPSPINYQSVCTLDKVKIALERAEKAPIKKRSSLFKSSVSPSNSSSSSSIKEIQEEEDEEKHDCSPIAAGCPGCLSYVLIMRNSPKCPRCGSGVPLPPPAKKPRIDLNMSI